MHYVILSSSGNALEWFTNEAEARRALAEMLATGADVDLVAFGLGPVVAVACALPTAAGNTGNVEIPHREGVNA